MTKTAKKPSTDEGVIPETSRFLLYKEHSTFWTKLLKNHTVWGRTYLYKGVRPSPPPPPTGHWTTRHRSELLHGCEIKEFRNEVFFSEIIVLETVSKLRKTELYFSVSDRVM